MKQPVPVGVDIGGPTRCTIAVSRNARSAPARRAGAQAKQPAPVGTQAGRPPRVAVSRSAAGAGSVADMALYHHVWYVQHRKEQAAKMKAWRAEHPEYVKAYNRAYAKIRWAKAKAI